MTTKAQALGPGLRSRLLLAFLGPTLLLLSLGGFFLYRASRSVLEEELGQSLSAVAATISAQLKADRVLALSPEDAQGEGSRTFRTLTAQLSEAKDAAGLRRVLVVDRDKRARLDVGGGLPPMTEAPELLRDEGELSRVFEGERAASQVLFEGKDGLFYKTGYAPLRLEGQVVGAVAVEGSAAFFGPLSLLRNAFVGLLALTLVLLAATAVLSAQALTRPLDALMRSALRIGGGDLVTPVSTKARGELGVLARELEAMRLSLEGRDRQLKMMLGGVAHEVRNPLGGMELFSGLLEEELTRERPDLKESLEHVRRVRKELDYLERIVDDFLAYAREQKLNVTQVDARAMLEGALAHLQGDAEFRGVSLTLDAEAGTVDGDENLLTGALVNLVKNAVQVSTKGQTVSVRGRKDGSGYLVEVVDAGPGVPAELQPRIFEPFFTTREKGTGLGLPLAKKLIEAHRGSLALDSRPGATVFTVRLPA